MAPAGNDKRRDKRLGLNLPVKFSLGMEPSLAFHTGVTHNVSSGGAYFEAPLGQVIPDAPVWIRIGVPARPDEVKVNLTLVGSGTVCRVERLSADRVVGKWPEAQLKQGICGIAFQFQQRPTIELRSLEELLWEDHR